MYKKMTGLLLVLVFVVSMLATVPVLGATAQKVVSIDIAHTKDMYGMNETGKVKITGLTENGETVTEFENVDYSIDYPVVTVSEDGTIKSVAVGYTVLTATVTNPDGSEVSDKMLLMVSTSGMVKNFNSYTVSSPDVNDHIAVETSNTRTGAQAVKIRTKDSDATKEKWGLDYGVSDFTDTQSTTSVTTAWFYDTGADSAVENLVPGAVYFQGFTNNHIKQADGSWATTGTGTKVGFTLSRITVGVKNLTDKYYFVTNADYQKDRRDVLPGMVVVRDIEGKDDTGYAGESDKIGTFYTDGEKMPLVKRTEGWHQVSIVIDMGKEGQANVATDNGSTKIFLDGELILEEKYVPNGYGTIRGTYPTATDETNTKYFGLYDDFYSLALVNEDRISYSQVKYSVGANGSVKVGDAEKTNGQKELIASGEDVTLALIPDDGYKATVKINGVHAPVSASNEVTIENIKANTEIEVSFELLPVTPSISGNDADYIVMEENYHNNQPAYIAYYKMDVPSNATLGEYGMYLNEEDGAEENELRLVARGKNDMNVFAIRVFGDAITADKNYTFRGFAVIDDQEYTD